ncbi:MAG: TetR/AcrR family transcriptional regulator [Acidimicrobiales bacterium]
MSDESTAIRRPPPTARREAAVDAFVDLLLEGRTPRPEEVADRAGVSMATLYRYFTSLDELRHDAMVRVLERFPHLLTVPQIGVGSRQQRIRRFVKARLDLHETLHPLALLQRASAFGDVGAATMVTNSRTLMADQIRLHFDDELRTLPPARREGTILALEMLTSVESWQSFRVSHDQTVARTRRAWTDAVDQLLPTP